MRIVRSELVREEEGLKFRAVLEPGPGETDEDCKAVFKILKQAVQRDCQELMTRKFYYGSQEMDEAIGILTKESREKNWKDPVKVLQKAIKNLDKKPGHFHRPENLGKANLTLNLDKVFAGHMNLDKVDCPACFRKGQLTVFNMGGAKNCIAICDSCNEIYIIERTDKAWED